MKRIIITPDQLVAINEAAIVSYTAPNFSQVTDTYRRNAINQGSANIRIANGPAENGKTIEVDNGGQGINQGDLADAAAQGGFSTDKISNVRVNSTQNTTQMEGRKYTKRQVELGRMLEMRKTGKVYSKQQLDEMFMETTDNADRLRAGIGNCRLFDIFKAVEEIFPEELEGVKEAFSNGSDIPEYIISIFGKGDVNSKKENEFLNALGL